MTKEELEKKLAEQTQAAEFNFQQYQDAGRLLFIECEKNELALKTIREILSSLTSSLPTERDVAGFVDKVSSMREAFENLDASEECSDLIKIAREYKQCFGDKRPHQLSGELWLKGNPE